MTADDAIRSAAAAWAVRTRDPEFDDWSAFTAWLEEDQRNSRAYDKMMLAADDAARLMKEGVSAPPFRTIKADEVPIASNDDGYKPSWSVGRRWLGGAIAASVAGVFAFGLMSPETPPTQYATNPGETLVIDLEDGAKIELGGGSELSLSGDNNRLATLIDGQATFSVAPHSHSSFKVRAGSDTIVDIGTVFDVRLDNSQLQVEVSEGAVVINPETQNLRLDSGKSLTKLGNSFSIEEVNIEAVGEWRTGRVTFKSATIDDIASRLTRATGINFSADTLSDARLSGSVLVEPIKADPSSVGPLLDLEVEQTGSGWVLSKL
ncbi:FecR domain-containing protein [Erythrobacter sp. YT30]|uniref:FecR family protein n=1 Tax=Erythrobacter sp. YT30 TaxID=1735012 RepID=UPI00076DC52D|nr:FecR domain-containing protein [Erythrobacter sp. YT30]KWV91048.1 hypothetical protein AUC45_06935 [Erythrobacter sp. YT30]